MILALLTGVAIVPVTYGLTPGVKASYDVQVKFEGYIPILGGQEGKVDLAMKVAVEGVKPPTPSAAPSPVLSAASEIAEFSLSFNGQKMPLDVKNVTEFFPRTTIILTPQGKMVKTDAPDSKLPFRLPGLDQKRFPDITYLPIEFPEAGIEEGKAFTFKKRFGDSDVAYTVTPTAISDAQIDLEVKMAQEYSVLEDSGGNVITDERDAIRRVTTKLEGGGKIVFDRTKGLIREMDIRAAADSKVLILETKQERDRKLTTHLSVKLKS